MRYMLFGFILEAYGWSIHRLYWGTWRVYKLYGNEKMDAWFVDHAYISLIPITITLIGMVMIIGPAMSLITGSGSRLKNLGLAAAMVLSISWLTYWKLGDAFEHQKINNEISIKEVRKPLSAFNKYDP